MNKSTLILGWFLTSILLATFATGLPVGVGFDVTKTVNITVSNSTLNVYADLAYNYSLSNTSASYSFPVRFNETVNVLNVTINDDNNSCVSQVLNQTAYLESVVRGQLVPSQQQYADLELLRFNDSAQCQDAKNILSNELLNYKVLLNTSEINYNLSLYALRQNFNVVREDLKLSQWANWGLTFVVLLMGVYIVKGVSPFGVWDGIVNQKFVGMRFFGSRPRKSEEEKREVGKDG